MHEGEFERKGCGNMKRYKVVFLFAMVASWMMIGEANDAVQTAAKTALRDVNLNSGTPRQAWQNLLAERS